MRVTNADRDAWLHEILMDSWIYGEKQNAKPGETFDDFYNKTVRGLIFPKPTGRRDDTDYRTYAIEGLPSIYLFAEETEQPEFESKLRLSSHYLDRDSTVVPISLESNYYIL